MKIRILFLFLFQLLVGRATNFMSSSFTTQTIDVPEAGYDVNFEVHWACDDFPLISAPGVIELFDAGGQKVGEVEAGIYRGSGSEYGVTGPGSVTENWSWAAAYTSGDEAADAMLDAVWHLTGIPAGTYTLRLWRYKNTDSIYGATTVWTTTSFVGGAAVSTPPQPPPPPASYALNVAAGAGGSAAGGGSFPAGTNAGLSATPDPGFDFVGWSGDASGNANPLVVTVDRDLNVLANFAPTAMSLATSALSGGNVSPGGSFPFGSWVTVSAAPDATHYFTGWSGDASGASPSVNVLMDRAKSVVAMFAAKNSQVINFANPGDQPVGATPALTATSSTGLPVTLTVVSGPATLSGNILTITASGPVTLQATQYGDGTTLPASPVSVTFNAVAAPAKLRVQPVARTILQDARTAAAANYVLSNP